ncbi:hypothetical protein K432DRAFT_395983 [Lepidopterella palustris CBS 459.81]|uniref:Uncharacterized protein n=1 Tax=Lepidopterella palustris CBS 459.81 TaxID=1314670 RepID=A0A8E2E4A9_9PEZI|nr:hypothetical protein K432DRAFT_395983 [Lepidopterella palustris CBS 459.81]
MGIHNVQNPTQNTTPIGQPTPSNNFGSDLSWSHSPSLPSLDQVVSGVVLPPNATKTSKEGQVSTQEIYPDRKSQIDAALSKLDTVTEDEDKDPEYEVEVEELYRNWAVWSRDMAQITRTRRQSNQNCLQEPSRDINMIQDMDSDSEHQVSIEPELPIISSSEALSPCENCDTLRNSQSTYFNRWPIACPNDSHASGTNSRKRHSDLDSRFTSTWTMFADPEFANGCLTFLQDAEFPWSHCIQLQSRAPAQASHAVCIAGEGHSDALPHTPPAPPLVSGSAQKQPNV